jgi:cell division protein FtsN
VSLFGTLAELCGARALTGINRNEPPVNETEHFYPIALRRRRWRRFYVAAALLSLPALGLLPILNMAQASRQAPLPAPAAATNAPPPLQHVDRPATITLGDLIEVQRRARAQRRALAAAEQQVAAMAPGEAWQAQLGAFSSADAAERQRGRLIEAGVPAVIEQAGSLHRLHSVHAMRAEIEGLCARAQASGIDCFMRRASDHI